MWLRYHILILLYAFLCECLRDDYDWGRNKAVRRFTSEGDLDIWTWEGVIKSMFFDETNSCLTADRNRPYSLVAVQKCPDDRNKPRTGQKWFMKGSIKGGLDSQMVFEGYIRSLQRGPEGEFLCLATHKDLYNTPMNGWDRHETAGWSPTDWEDLPDNQVRTYRQMETAWGPAYLDICSPNNKNQIWHIGLGRPIRERAPEKWTW
ncbi:hypothetical protein ABW20_dc0106674 [Dactylellina cionopaga]|nr:hypothetical protein ABW20_dc0106674 [Dactylellina cionopaga]